MKVGIIGSGGREHAICESLNKSDKIEKIYCFPGNAGTKQIAENIEVNLDNFEYLKKFSLEKKIDFQNQGYSIIISFFDESIQYDKFGCFSFEGLKQDLEFLAKTAMEINALVLFKPQFSQNSIQHIFKDSTLINEAFSSKNKCKIT